MVLAFGSASAVAPASAGAASEDTASEGNASEDNASERNGSERHGHVRRAAPYVALGDSYSSGEGTGVYFRRTDTASNRCHRSPLAYPALLTEGHRRSSKLSFVACSGAQTVDLYRRNHQFSSEPAQLARLSRRTRAVSLTIGGNDVGFVEVVGACLHSPQVAGFGCRTNAALTGAVEARTAALRGIATVPGGGGYPITAIPTVLRDIAARAPRAKIYLAGYPELFGSSVSGFRSDPSAPSAASCVLNAAARARVDYADAQWINAATRRLNATLSSAVQQARTSGIRARFVSAARFDGHGLCDVRMSWIQPLLLNEAGEPRSESLHPTQRGHRRGYAPAFRRAGF